MLVRNYRPGEEKWSPGVIRKQTGPVSLLVKLADGRFRRCHQDQVRTRHVQLTQRPSVKYNVSIPTAETPIVVEESK